MKKLLIALVIAALIGGGIAYYEIYQRPKNIAALEQQTKTEAEALRDQIATITETLRNTETKTREVVTVYRDKTIQEVKALPADSVADGLNSELELFRTSGMDIRPEGVSNGGSGVLRK